MYEKFEDLGALSTIIYWAKERGIRINRAEKSYFVLAKFFGSKSLSRKTKVRLYIVIIRPAFNIRLCSVDNVQTSKKKVEDV